MIQDWQIQRDDDRLILGLAIESAVLDIVSDHTTIRDCLTLLDSPHQGLVDRRLGAFGPFPVTLNLHHDDLVSIFVDGPDFDQTRCQSAAIWVEKAELRSILQHVIDKA